MAKEGNGKKKTPRLRRPFPIDIRKDGWDIFEIIGKIVILGFVAPLVVNYVVSELQRQDRERQLQEQIRLQEARRISEDNQILLSLRSQLTSPDEKIRQQALTLVCEIASSVCSVAVDLVAGLATSEEEQRTTEERRQRSAETKARQEFAFHVGNAQQFEAFQAFPHAYLEFKSAYQAIRAFLDEDVPQNLVDEADKKYRSGEHREAAQLMAEAVRKVMSQM